MLISSASMICSSGRNFCRRTINFKNSVIYLDSVRMLHNTSENSESTTENREDTILYKGNSQFLIRGMLGLSSLNLLYWGGSFANYMTYKDVVVNGISLAGDPIWSYVGGVATLCMFYAGRKYSHHSVYRSYETADGKRLGFQMLNMFGNPGRKVEVSIGNARAVVPKDVVDVLARKRAAAERVAELKASGGVDPEEVEDAKSLHEKKISTILPFLGKGTSIPIIVKGFTGGNLLLDDGGKFFENMRLLELVLEPCGVISTPGAKSPVEKAKEERVQWRREATSVRSKKK